MRASAQECERACPMKGHAKHAADFFCFFCSASLLLSSEPLHVSAEYLLLLLRMLLNVAWRVEPRVPAQKAPNPESLSSHHPAARDDRLFIKLIFSGKSITIQNFQLSSEPEFILFPQNAATNVRTRTNLGPSQSSRGVVCGRPPV